MAQRSNASHPFKFQRFSRKNYVGTVGPVTVNEQPSQIQPQIPAGNARVNPIQPQNATDDAHVNSNINSLAAAFQKKTQQLGVTSNELCQAQEEIHRLKNKICALSSDNNHLHVVTNKLLVVKFQWNFEFVA